MYNISMFINNSNNSITAYINIFCNPKLLLIDLILILEAFCSNPAQCIFFAAFILVSSSCFSEKLRHFQKFYYSSSCQNLTQQLEKFSPLSMKMLMFYKCPDGKHDLVSEERSDLLLTSYYILLLLILCDGNTRFILSSPTCFFNRA